MQLEYSKYLQEVVSALENDPEFRAKLDKADEADIRVSRRWRRKRRRRTQKNVEK